MPMRCKISNNELIGLIAIYAELVRKTKLMFADSEDIETLLYLAVFETTYVRLQKKAFIWKRKYTLNLPAQEAIALWIQFNGIMDESTQAGNFMQGLCNKIHQQIITNVNVMA